MKYLSVGIFVVVLLLSGCSEEKTTTSDATIKKAELTKFEESLVDLTGDHSFVFDIELKNDQVTDITETIDYYENGEFVEHISKMGTKITQDDDFGTIRTVFIQRLMGDHQEQWITSIMDDGGQSSGLFKKDITGREKMSSGSGGLNEAPLIMGEKKVIATIVYTNKQGLSIYHDIETKEQLEKATDYEQVYVISVEIN